MDINRPGVYSWITTVEGRSVRKGLSPDREEAANAVSDTLDQIDQPPRHG